MVLLEELAFSFESGPLVEKGQAKTSWPPNNYVSKPLNIFFVPIYSSNAMSTLYLWQGSWEQHTITCLEGGNLFWRPDI